ncbi:MAG: DUF433 domain-containing protein [Verrucomicrobia subdivision 3 bacterium]|nr:DUF433 domain-containing protein [Limisphaerales bacterium]
MSKKVVGRYIVADPRICHGQPTFRGTRILVTDVLEQVATGMAWKSIVEEWRDAISEEAIAEAVRLARETFQEHAHELAVYPCSDVNVLDENILESQRQLLRSWRIPVRQIGVE